MSQAAARADATTIAAAPSTSPQSQLKGLTGQPVAINPQGETARFMLGDIQGKEAATAFRLSMIHTAVLEVLKGNPRNLKEAVALAGQLGKGKKARAYAAGFAPLADVEALERVGKWMDSANAAVRTQADTLADAYTAQFASAHATVMAEKAAPKAKKATTPEQALASVKAVEAAKASIDANATDDAPVEMDIGELVDGVVSALQQGMLSAEEVTLLRAALAAIDATEGDAALVHLLTSTPVLLQQQAH